MGTLSEANLCFAEGRPAIPVIACGVWGDAAGRTPHEAGLSLRAIEVEASILNPSAGFSANNRIYRALKKDRTRVVGRLLNQDACSLNLSDSSGNLVTLFKADRP